jgi:N-acetylmuramoyl-L-alanine amidase
MAKVERIKRQLVRQAVQENLELIEGRRVSVRRRRRSALRWAALAVALPLAVLVSSYAISSNVAVAVPTAAGPAATPAPAAAAPGAPGKGLETEAEVEVPAALLEAPVAVDHEVFPLAVRRVALDPGHGGASLGTHTSSGLEEKELTLDIARRLETLLAAAGFEVLMTRQGDDSVALEDRARFANSSRADLFISIHLNWIPDGGSRGVETYYLGTTDDPYLNHLAATENRDSGYSLADLRRLLDRIYSGVRVGKSRDLAESVQASLYQSLRKINPQLRDRGVKTAPFLVLVETEMPAVLAEVSCLSNQREADLLTKPLYRQFIAEALFRGIHSYAGTGNSQIAAEDHTAGP